MPTVCPIQPPGESLAKYTPGSATRQSWFTSLLCPVLATWPWASDLTSLSLSLKTQPLQEGGYCLCDNHRPPCPRPPDSFPSTSLSAMMRVQGGWPPCWPCPRLNPLTNAPMHSMFYVSVVSDCFIDSAAHVSSMIYPLLPPTSLCGPGRVIHPHGSQTPELVGGTSEVINPGLTLYL